MWIVYLILVKYQIQSFLLAKNGHVIYQLTVPRDSVTTSLGDPVPDNRCLTIIFYVA